MRVDRMDLYSNNDEVARFDVTGYDVRNPYIIKAVTGLDADNIIPRFYSRGSGSQANVNFYDLALEPREVAMKIGMNPNYSVNVRAGHIRDDLYKAIASNRSGIVELRFLEENLVVGRLMGFVTKFEAPLFGKDPEVTITMRCDEPMIKSAYTTSLPVAGLSTADPLLIDPISTAPHGFNFQITFTSTITLFTISNEFDYEWRFQLAYPSFTAGNTLFFSSEVGSKYILYQVGGTVIPLMDSLTPGSIWPIMFPGENQFHFSPSTFNWVSIGYTETHWGV